MQFCSVDTCLPRNIVGKCKKLARRLGNEVVHQLRSMSHPSRPKMQNGRTVGLNQGLDLAKHLVRCANQTRELSQLGFFWIGGDGRVNEIDTRSLSSACNAAVDWGRAVVASTMICPARKSGFNSATTASTTLESLKQKKITSLAADSSANVEDSVVPRTTKSSTGARLRWAITERSLPALMRFFAMPCPIIPTPTNPILVITLTLSNSRSIIDVKITRLGANDQWMSES